jgi:hypothetical protein
MVNGRSKQKTSEGIGFGRSEKDVRSTYGDPERVEETTSGKYLIYADLGLTFAIRDGKVVTWLAHR